MSSFEQERLRESAWQLLDNYQAESAFFFASPNHTLLGQLSYVDLISQTALLELEQRVNEALQRAERGGEVNPVVVGALPFAPDAAAYLALPSRVVWAGPLHAEAQPYWHNQRLPHCSIEPMPAPEHYKQGVAQALAKMQAGDLQKVVLSRSLQLTAEAPLDVNLILANLARNNKTGYTFAVPLPTRRALVGASPELLLARNGNQVIANPLAGSIPRSADPEEDARRAAGLLESPKDLHEHKVVIEAVAAALAPFCLSLDVPQPTVISTATMWHLSTTLVGELKPDAPSSLGLALALHPTPAVCGTPTEVARAAIREIEPFDRGFFTGMVGWCNAQGDGEWIVTIRCAEVVDQSLRLFAGAGVVLGSTPEAELAETAAKFRTMLLAMGIDSEGEVA
ncbi:MAG TPA: isochorismate synthase DhbC [Herpetosiphon sp.]|uniref:isochorismate synthase n=1 Tax=Herpetosiphon aurantiacus (strain ATCC 23779 / DSM 785 / 114-95) TaxID=316274 RepID=A9B7R7_HERA2|nr:isochorismate synthase DhbC [Herpetosiphon sp.]ABX04445.1 isochorismate synthase [Herpetosiphon aurantiacus DSM 785]HBW52303.1 isochorismate synthase DhbC [Herpetosiphon sp.]